jgi:AcrR family transcriptional regulator
LSIPASRRKPLSRERILDAAIRLADESGIESLTMRKLARALGVEAMSLYNHVANKGDLVDAMADSVMAEIELPETGEWDEAIRTCALSANRALLRHPWACSAVLVPSNLSLGDSPRLRYMEWLLRRLREAGFPAGLVYSGYHAIDSHILGFTMWQLAHATGVEKFGAGRDLAALVESFVSQLRDNGFPHLAAHAEQHVAAPEGDGAREFAFALDLILDGLSRARVTEEGGARRSA